MLYFHGGVYVFGSAHAYRHLAGQLAARAGSPRRTSRDPRAVAGAIAGPLVVAGDSAGGGLALALLADRTRRPLRGLLLSPWLDLALTGDSMVSRAADDPLLSRAALERGVAAYLPGGNTREPLASPLYDDLRELPPTQVHVGTAEVLLDDARRLAERASIELHVWDGLPHTFVRNVHTLIGARVALDLAGTFLAGAPCG
jgi:acetyl esterase/lipase